MRIKIGDFVRCSRHGQTGRVYQQPRKLTNDDDYWVSQQIPKLTIEEIQDDYVSVLCHNQGSVLVPVSSCVKIPPIEGFNNAWEKEYFK